MGWKEANERRERLAAEQRALAEVRDGWQPGATPAVEVATDRVRPRRSRARARVERRAVAEGARPLPPGCHLSREPGPSGSSLRYPDRMRCRTCRSFFSVLVLDGLYCSYRCAGLPEPPELDDAPRECVTANHGASYRTWKKPYPTASEAHDRRTKMQEVYHCSTCHHWHLGTPADRKKEDREKPLWIPPAVVSGPSALEQRVRGDRVAVQVALVKNADGMWVRPGKFV